MSAKHKGVGPQSMTANELHEGYSVWLTPEFTWSAKFEEALLTEDPEKIEKMRSIADRDVEDNQVVGAYFIDINPETNLPTRYRELFRIKGPSNDLGEELKKD